MLRMPAARATQVHIRRGLPAPVLPRAPNRAPAELSWATGIYLAPFKGWERGGLGSPWPAGCPSALPSVRAFSALDSARRWAARVRAGEARAVHGGPGRSRTGAVPGPAEAGAARKGPPARWGRRGGQLSPGRAGRALQPRPGPRGGVSRAGPRGRSVGEGPRAGCPGPVPGGDPALHSHSLQQRLGWAGQGWRGRREGRSRGSEGEEGGSRRTCIPSRAARRPRPASRRARPVPPAGASSRCQQPPRCPPRRGSAPGRSAGAAHDAAGGRAPRAGGPRPPPQVRAGGFGSGGAGTAGEPNFSFPRRGANFAAARRGCGGRSPQVSAARPCPGTAAPAAARAAPGCLEPAPGRERWVASVWEGG